ncbi:MarR family transcriptional regulator [Escherichia coli]|nr:MarR family transcriptional regulator [Escherichia coli]
MNNTELTEKIIRHQHHKDGEYPFQEHLLTRLCILLNKKMCNNITEAYGRYGINHSMFMVLILLSTAENHCLSPSEISKELQLKKPNVTRITDFLEKSGFTERSDNKEDRRGKKICLTSEGMSFIKKITTVQRIQLKKIWSCLTSDELELFEKINKKLLAHLSDL